MPLFMISSLNLKRVMESYSIMQIIKFETLESKLIALRDTLVLIDKDVAEIYGVETKRVNEAVKNNQGKFPDETYVIELFEDEKKYVVENFDHLSKLKYSPHVPKAFTEKGLYMLATILKSDVATQATLQIVETFAKIKELSRNINAIMKTTDKSVQKELAQKSNKILEEVIDIDDDVFDDDVEGEIIETQTKFEFNLGFAKVSRSIKKITGKKK